MGAAFDSLVLVIGITGPITLLALVWTLVTRAMRTPRNRGFLQRFPVLLPAVLFIISVIIINQIGILPMAQYKGSNYLNTSAASGNTFRFNVYEPNDAYSDGVQLLMGVFFLPGESMNISVRFYLENQIKETINSSLTATGTEGLVTKEQSVVLAPGSYIVQVNYTFFDQGIPDGMSHWLDVTLSQPIKSVFVPEIVSWSSMQFGLGVGCFFLFLGGFCIGGPNKSRYVEEDEQDAERTDYGDGSPEYGKGC